MNRFIMTAIFGIGTGFLWDSGKEALVIGLLMTLIYILLINEIDKFNQ